MLALTAGCFCPPVQAREDTEVLFRYLSLAENEKNDVYSREFRKYAVSEEETGFRLNSQILNFRSRFMRYGYPENGEFLENVIHSSQEQQEGDGGNWEEVNRIWLPKAGVYRVSDDRQSVRFEEQRPDGNKSASLDEEEQAKVLDFLSKPAFFERMGRFLDGRTFRIGSAFDPGPEIDTALGAETLSRNMVLEEVEPRWGRQIARFRIETMVQGSEPLEKNWTVDVDMETGRTLRSISEMKTVSPIRNVDNNGAVSWVHIAWYGELTYRYENVRVDRSGFQLVNPSFLSPGGAQVQDIAYLEKSEALALLEESSPDAAGETQQTIGTWNLNSQGVTKVMVSNSGRRIFASETASSLMQANDGLHLSGFLVMADAFSPFGSYLRYPNEERFSSWDLLGIYGVAGTTVGRIAFINTGWSKEMGVYPVSDEAIVGVDVHADNRLVASLDQGGRLRLHEIGFDENCGDKNALEAYCKDLLVHLGDQLIDETVFDEACAAAAGETLRLVPGTKTVATVLFQPDADCRPQGEIQLLDLETGDAQTLPGQAFSVTKDGRKIVTAFGVYQVDSPGKPVLRFDTAIADARKIVLAETQELAFILTRSGLVYMVDLRAGLVVDELVSPTGFPALATVLARDFWQQRYFALTSDGTLIVEHPETNRSTFVDLAEMAGLPDPAVLLDATLLRTEGRLVAAFAVEEKGARFLHLVAVNEAGEASVIARLPVSDQPVHQLVSADNDKLYVQSDENLAVIENDKMEMRSLDIELTFHRLFGFDIHSVASREYAFFLQQRYIPGKGQLLPTIVQAEIGDSNVRLVRAFDFPTRFGWTADGAYPFAISRDGRLAAIANLRPPENGWWNESGRIIVVMDLQSGEVHAEVFQDWADTTSLDFSPDGLTLAVGQDTGSLSVFDLKRGIRKMTFKAHDGRLEDVSWRDDELITRGEDGVTRIWDPGLMDLDPHFRDPVDTIVWVAYPNMEFLTATVFDPMWDPESRRLEGSVTITSDGYYAGDKNRLRRIRFVQSGINSVDLSEADLQRNRPDIVFSRTGMISDGRKDLLARLYDKRLKEYGLASAPAPVTHERIEAFGLERISPAVTQKPRAEFDLTFKSDLPLKDVVVRNNGIVLSRVGAKRGEHKVSIPLEPGVNRLQFVGLDESGGERTLHRSTLRYSEPNDILPPQLYLFAVGVSDYADDTLDLTYAAKDARDLAGYFGALPNSIVATATDSEATADVIERAKRFFARARPQDRTLFFFAGHGLLDPEYRYFLGSHETRTDNLADTALSFAALETVFDDTRSLHRAIFLDACHSGAVDPEIQSAGLRTMDSGSVIAREARGAMSLVALDDEPVTLEDSYEALRASFLDSRSRSGANIISASGGLQFAFENGTVANGLFTYALIEGLRTGNADRNADKQIELSELFQYVADEVTRLSNGRQVPTVRSEPLFSRFAIN